QIKPSKQAPWYASVSDTLREAKRSRRRAERRYLKSGLTVHKQIFNASKRLVTSIVHTAKTIFYSTKISECNTSKQLFGVCSRLIGSVKVSPLPTVFPIKQLPQVFSDFFMQKVSDIRAELDSLPVPPYPAEVSDPPLQSEFRSFQPVTEQQLKKVILLSKPTTCSLDPIPTPLLLECLDSLLPTLTHIVNLSLTSGSVPSIYKMAVVKPLLKKPSLDQNNLKSYRPVSNLPFLSKILEKVVLQQLLEYLNLHNLLPSSQSAYRPAHSTETLLLKITNDILCALDDGNVSVLTLLDLSAAFDTIDHALLLNRLHSLYGISGAALAWFKSYLFERFQSVTLSNDMSQQSPLSFGVPQGSVLGPVLFVLYTKPLTFLTASHSVSSQSFADDTQLQNSCPPSELHDNIQTVQSCILDVKTWMVQNKLKLNDEKTEVLLLKSKATCLPSPEPICMQVGCHSVNFTS
ncbi:MAG: reverse transcriptase family protein, partial [Gammaproteobacteria bacterium]|nr:reverse transcriptase family protein [Gammaproteobacteria bacterium]